MTQTVAVAHTGPRSVAGLAGFSTQNMEIIAAHVADLARQLQDASISTTSRSTVSSEATAPEALWVTCTAVANPGRTARIAEGVRLQALMVGQTRHTVEPARSLEVSVRDLFVSASYKASPEGRAAIRTFLLLMGINQVMWASAVDYDRRLLNRIATVNMDSERRSLHQAEREVTQLARLYKHVAFFRAQLQSFTAHLTTEGRQYWNCLDDGWGLGRYVESLNDKLDALDHLQREVATSVSARRARRLGSAAFLFAATGVVTLFVDVITFTYNPLQALQPTLLTVALLLILGAAGLSMWVVSEPRGRR